MEGENGDMLTSGGAPATSRWNPTKEQISMLERLYVQGIRTPSAEQIQEITSRLKVYGHIEGKNVFYWFQNHKARQRQKQKQENMAYFTRYLHTNPHHHVFPPPNVVCSPYYLPQRELGFYQQCPKVLLPGGIKRRPKLDKVENKKTNVGTEFEPSQLGHKHNIMINNTTTTSSQETLPLFPVEPTGILEARTESPSLSLLTSAENSTTHSSSSEIEEGYGDQPFFDFFSGNGSCESD